MDRRESWSRCCRPASPGAAGTQATAATTAASAAAARAVARSPTPTPEPDDFVDTIDNPYLPYLPGTRWVYENTSSEGDERIVVTVTDRTRVVQGVRTTVVRDTVTDENGEVVEDTYDWFAQDTAGNVWYFGEDTTVLRGREGHRRRARGRPASTGPRRGS